VLKGSFFTLGLVNILTHCEGDRSSPHILPLRKDHGLSSNASVSSPIPQIFLLYIFAIFIVIFVEKLGQHYIMVRDRICRNFVLLESKDSNLSSLP
jgi:hypothetical protein